MALFSSEWSRLPQHSRGRGQPGAAVTEEQSRLRPSFLARKPRTAF